MLATSVTLAIGATTMAMATPAVAQGGGDQEAFCKSVADISLVFNTIEDQPSKKQQRKLARLADRVESNAPSELNAPVTTAVEAVRSGNFDDPAVFEAIGTVDQWVVDNCGYAVHPVTAVEYEFQGMPSSVDTGINLFDFDNQGAEIHEIVIVRIKGDETAEELLDLPEKQVEKKVEFIAATGAAQGETSVVYADLKRPGRYAAVCFVPVGATSEEAAQDAEGPPHAVEGMVTEFEVERAT
jgi:hypothetical protein